MWKVPKIWEGQRCFILGGGASVPRQFGVPEDIVQKVVAKELPVNTYAQYIDPIIGQEHIIAINNAYMISPLVDILFFGDASWFLIHKHNLHTWRGLKVTCCPRFSNEKKANEYGFKFLAKDREKRNGVSIKKGHVSWNSNSGAASISLAAQLGVKEIILLGFDMKMTPVKGKTLSHWHGDNKLRKPPPFKRHLRGFPEIAKDAKSLGIKILNCSDDTTIESFPIIKIEDVLNVK